MNNFGSFLDHLQESRQNHPHDLNNERQEKNEPSPTRMSTLAQPIDDKPNDDDPDKLEKDIGDGFTDALLRKEEKDDSNQ